MNCIDAWYTRMYFLTSTQKLVALKVKCFSKSRKMIMCVCVCDRSNLKF